MAIHFTEAEVKRAQRQYNEAADLPQGYSVNRTPHNLSVFVDFKTQIASLKDLGTKGGDYAWFMSESKLRIVRRSAWTHAIQSAIITAPEGVTPDTVYSTSRNIAVDFIRYNDGSIAFHVQLYNGSFSTPIMHTPFPLRDISDVLAIVAR